VGSNLLVDDKLWVIRIDATMSATEGSFPMHCHVTWANKIARAVLSSNVQWEAGSLEVLQPLLLSEAQTEDLESKFTPAIPAAIDEELLMEQIAAADAAHKRSTLGSACLDLPRIHNDAE
jgi:hypothetical protein